jgi:membrane fusion protein (multidrug efflux system)
MRAIMHKTVLLIFALMACFLPAMTAYAEGPSMPPAEVDVYRVQPSDTVFTKDLSGRTSAYQTAEIRPQVSGIITKRMFTEGSYVKKGEQLYQIDPSQYQAAFESAQAALMRAEANLLSVEPRVGRYEELVSAGGVSRQELDDAVSALMQAKAEIAAAKAAVTQAKINLQYTKVFAPISGRIGRSMVTEGALVTANQPSALAVIQNLDKIYVDVNESGTEIMKMRREMSGGGLSAKAKLIIDGDEALFSGEGDIQFSDVTVDVSTGMVQLRILFENPANELLPGLFVKARVEKSKESGLITVPQQSVMRAADGSVITWVVDADGKVAVRPVKTGRAVGDKWVITQGLNAGDRVMTSGFQKTAPGAVVSPVEISR